MQHLSAAKLKLFAGLHRRRERQAAQLFLCEGSKLAAELLRAQWPIAHIIVTPDYLAQHPQWATDTRCLLAPARDLARLSTQPAPEGIVVVAELPQPVLPAGLPGPALLLHGLNDPGNLGSIIRSAQWFGYGVYCSADSVDCYNPKVVRAAMGSLFYTPTHYLTDFDAQVQAHSQRIYAAAMQGVSIAGHMPEPARDLILLGSESHGIPPALLQLPGMQPIHIAAQAGSQAESLNVGVAAGILMHWHRAG